MRGRGCSLFAAPTGIAMGRVRSRTAAGGGFPPAAKKATGSGGGVGSILIADGVGEASKLPHAPHPSLFAGNTGTGIAAGAATGGTPAVVTGGLRSSGFVSGGSVPSTLDVVRREIETMRRDEEVKKQVKIQQHRQTQQQQDLDGDRGASSVGPVSSGGSLIEDEPRHDPSSRLVNRQWGRMSMALRPDEAKKVKEQDAYVHRLRQTQLEELFRGGPTATTNRYKKIQTPMPGSGKTGRNVNDGAEEERGDLMSAATSRMLSGDGGWDHVRQYSRLLHNHNVDVRAPATATVAADHGRNSNPRAPATSTAAAATAVEAAVRRLTNLKAAKKREGLFVVRSSMDKDDIRDDDGNSTAADDAAFLGALEEMSDAELALLLRAGVLEPAGLSSGTNVAADAPASPDNNEAVSTTPTGSPSPPAAADDVDVGDFGGSLEDACLLLSDDLAAAAHGAARFTRAVQDVDLNGAPDPDTAHLLLRAELAKKTNDNARFQDFTEEELTRLEAFEERTKQVTQRLTPQNSVLAQIAEEEGDEFSEVRESLEVLERVKRACLDDPEFQNALRHVHMAEVVDKRKVSKGIKPRYRRGAAEHTFFFPTQGFEGGSSAGGSGGGGERGGGVSRPPPNAAVRLGDPRNGTRGAGPAGGRKKSPLARYNAKLYRQQ